MDRRTVLSGSVLLALTSGAAEAASVEQATHTIIEAPDDVYVESIMAPNGPVKSGQPLIGLKSYRLEQHRNQLELLRQHIAITERPFLDGRVDEEIKQLKEKNEDLQQFADSTSAQLETFKAKYNLGLTDALTVDQMRRTDLQAKANLLDVKLAVLQADRKKQDALDRIALAKQKLNVQSQLLDEMSKRMIVAASTSGRFSADVPVGFFAKKGHPLGIIA